MQKLGGMIRLESACVWLEPSTSLSLPILRRFFQDNHKATGRGSTRLWANAAENVSSSSNAVSPLPINQALRRSADSLFFSEKQRQKLALRLQKELEGGFGCCNPTPSQYHCVPEPIMMKINRHLHHRGPRTDPTRAEQTDTMILAPRRHAKGTAGICNIKLPVISMGRQKEPLISGVPNANQCKSSRTSKIAGQRSAAHMGSLSCFKAGDAIVHHEKCISRQDRFI